MRNVRAVRRVRRAEETGPRAVPNEWPALHEVQKRGAVSRALPSSLFTTDPIAGRPPTFTGSFSVKPDWHWKASCLPSAPTSERRKTYLPAFAASLGRSSVTWKPGIFVRIDPNSPRISDSASGFGTIRPICGGPPSRWILMTALLDERIPAAFSARSMYATVSPPKPITPAYRKFRRPTPRHVWGCDVTVAFGWNGSFTDAPRGRFAPARRKAATRG